MNVDYLKIILKKRTNILFMKISHDLRRMILFYLSYTSISNFNK